MFNVPLVYEEDKEMVNKPEAERTVVVSGSESIKTREDCSTNCTTHQRKPVSER